MNGTMANPLLAQLDDIKGLDKISWWPLAPGWWVILALVAIAVVVSVVLYFRRRAYGQSWRGDAEKELSALEIKLNDQNTQEVVAALSITLRRIAMQRFSRAACAGVEGQGWLQWLTAKDPRGFNWMDRGGLLMEAPYAPPGQALPSEIIKELIHATKEWVR